MMVDYVFEFGCTPGTAKIDDSVIAQGVASVAHDGQIVFPLGERQIVAFLIWNAIVNDLGLSRIDWFANLDDSLMDVRFSWQGVPVNVQRADGGKM